MKRIHNLKSKATVKFIINTAIEVSLTPDAGVTKRSTVVDSRSTRVGVRGFESLLPHHIKGDFFVQSNSL
jgi:hypothetical protein